MHNTAMMIVIKNILIGIFIGLANVIPGVSGGTVAVICNVYDKLIILTSLDIKKIKAEWKPLLFLAIGLGCGIVGFAKLVTILYQFYPVQTNFFFLGIILGSIPFLYGKIRDTEYSSDKLEGIHFYWNRAVPLLLCGIGAALMLTLFFIQKKGVSMASTPLESMGMLSTGLKIKLFFIGIVSACTMLIPGISGSFVLLIFGVYQTIIQAVSGFNIPLLIPFGAGMCIGLVSGARLIAFFLSRFPAQMYGFILGLVAGSAVYLFPNVCQPLFMRLLSAAALLLGYSLVSFFSAGRSPLSCFSNASR